MHYSSTNEPFLLEMGASGTACVGPKPRGWCSEAYCLCQLVFSLMRRTVVSLSSSLEWCGQWSTFGRTCKATTATYTRTTKPWSRSWIPHSHQGSWLGGVWPFGSWTWISCIDLGNTIPMLMLCQDHPFPIMPYTIISAVVAEEWLGCSTEGGSTHWQPSSRQESWATTPLLVAWNKSKENIEQTVVPVLSTSFASLG